MEFCGMEEAEIWVSSLKNRKKCFAFNVTVYSNYICKYPAPILNSSNSFHKEFYSGIEYKMTTSFVWEKKIIFTLYIDQIHETMFENSCHFVSGILPLFTLITYYLSMPIQKSCTNFQQAVTPLKIYC